MPRTVRVGDICHMNTATISKKDRSAVIQYLDTGSIKRNIIENIQTIDGAKDNLPSRAQRKVKDNTIIYSTVRPKLEHYGFISPDRSGYIVSTGFATLDVYDKDVDPKYFYYLLTQRYITKHLHRVASSSVSSYPSINPDDIEDLTFVIPNNISEQQKVSKVLSLIDAKIENNTKINNALARIIKEVFALWFIQYDFPDANGRPYKSSGGAMVYDKLTKRDVPAEWTVDPLAKLISFDKSGDWGSSSQLEDTDIQVLCIRGADINGLKGKTFLTPPVRYIPASSQHKLLAANDAIIEISGGSPSQSTGRITYVTEHSLSRFELPLITSNFCKAISFKDKRMVYYFANLWETLYDQGAFFGFEGKTSGIKNLLFDSFVNSYYIAQPNSGIIKQFYEYVDGYELTKQRLLEENDNLESMKTWLLPILLNS